MLATEDKSRLSENSATTGPEPKYHNFVSDSGYVSVPRIMTIDDDDSVQRLMQKVLQAAHYENEPAANAEEARALLKTEKYELVLCDIGLPGESGLTFIKWLSEAYPETTSIMVTGCDDMDMAEQSLKYGAHSYIVKPFTNRDLLLGIAGALKNRQKQIQSEKNASRLQKEIDLRTRELASSNQRLKQTMRGIIKAMATTLEFRDPYTVGHQQRVADLAAAIGEKLGLDDDRLEALYIASMVHDIGKISVPAEILNKPGSLTSIEFSLIKTHAETGHKILKEINFPWPIAEIVHQHHERIDGSGYPRGLREKDLTLEARIITVADVVEAMASHRPYRPALSIESALGEVKANQDRYYSAEVVDACLAVFENDAYRLDAASPQTG
ncbi:MAG: HD domain-containing phosphohydrolase [Desulfosudaceae bacterium]